MKTYLLDSINKYKRFSENLDVKTILCNKSWRVYNDSGEKEIYIFQEDGSLIVSVNGQVTNANWKYISANKSLIINTAQQAVMLHPAFMDNALFVLQLDGTNNFAFLIDEANKVSFQPKSLNDVKNYFLIEEKKQVKLEIEDVCKKKFQTIANRTKSSKHYEKWRTKGFFRLFESSLKLIFFGSYFALIALYLLESLPNWILNVFLYFKGWWIVVFFLLTFFVTLGFLPLLSDLIIKRLENRSKKFKLTFQNKDDVCVEYGGNLDGFNLWCLKKNFYDFSLTNSNNVAESISSFMQGKGKIEISYIYKGNIIGVDKFDLELY